MKTTNKVFLFLLSGFISLGSLANNANDFDDKLLYLQHEWANVNYTLKGDSQEDAFDELSEEAQSFVKKYPERAETWIWQGIIQSSYAGAKGGLGALSLAKQAKKSFEKAIEIDDSALSGTAYTSLGALYHKVPGWPIAFGDDDDAKVFLEKALAINPTGIDANYFYGEFMLDERNYEKAKNHFIIAKSAPGRELRSLADKYRHLEIEELLNKAEKKLKKH